MNEVQNNEVEELRTAVIEMINTIICENVHDKYEEFAKMSVF